MAGIHRPTENGGDIPGESRLSQRLHFIPRMFLYRKYPQILTDPAPSDADYLNKDHWTSPMKLWGKCVRFFTATNQD